MLEFYIGLLAVSTSLFVFCVNELLSQEAWTAKSFALLLGSLILLFFMIRAYKGGQKAGRDRDSDNMRLMREQFGLIKEQKQALAANNPGDTGSTYQSNRVAQQETLVKYSLFQKFARWLYKKANLP